MLGILVRLVDYQTADHAFYLEVGCISRTFPCHKSPHFPICSVKCPLGAEAEIYGNIES